MSATVKWEKPGPMNLMTIGLVTSSKEEATVPTVRKPKAAKPSCCPGTKR